MDDYDPNDEIAIRQYRENVRIVWDIVLGRNAELKDVTAAVRSEKECTKSNKEQQLCHNSDKSTNAKERVTDCSASVRDSYSANFIEPLQFSSAAPLTYTNSNASNVSNDDIALNYKEIDMMRKLPEFLFGSSVSDSLEMNNIYSRSLYNPGYEIFDAGSSSQTSSSSDIPMAKFHDILSELSEDDFNAKVDRWLSSSDTKHINNAIKGPDMQLFELKDIYDRGGFKYVYNKIERELQTL